MGQVGIETYQNLWRRHVATFGMAVHADYQGQGIGGELIKAMLDMCDSWFTLDAI